jgi:RNA polymerase sigma-70 factor (ECF subfamily)
MSSEEVSGMTDASLVVAIARWRQEALAEAYRRHGGGVFGLARRLLGDGESAKEIAQEVFLRLWKQPERFDPSRGSLRSYLLAQTHGRSVDVLRSETARRRREELDVRTATDIVDDVERQVQDLAVGAQVRDALAGLPEAERRAVALAYLAGNTYREVACLLGEPEGTVKTRIRSGLRHLRLPLTQAGLVGT